MRLAGRMAGTETYAFAALARAIARKRAAGEDVVSLISGDPELPPADPVLEALRAAALDPANHRYPESEGLPELRAAFADWYARRFGTALDPEREVLPLLGSKEGIGHIALCFIDPGDVALVPEPAYAVYRIGTVLAGGAAHDLPLTEENDYLPELEAIPAGVRARAKMLWLNYPSNPLGATADLDFFARAVDFARRHDLLVCHDAAYSEIAFDGYRPPSILQAPGAREVAVEFHTLSKTYRMAGWRVGMAVGNATAVEALARLKANLDSGIPQAIQRMAIAALRGPQDGAAEYSAVLQRRRDRMVAAMRRAGIEVRPPKAALYIWARVPAGFTSAEFAARLLEEIGVAVTPGAGYGPHGEGYFRVSLTAPDDRLDEAVARLGRWRPAVPDRGD